MPAGNDQLSVADAGLTNNTQLFLWDGEMVGGETVTVGRSCEPVLLHVTYPTDEGECELSSGYPKNSTLGQLRVEKLTIIISLCFSLFFYLCDVHNYYNYGEINH